MVMVTVVKSAEAITIAGIRIGGIVTAYPHVVTELDVSSSAPSQHRDEHLEFVRLTPDVRPICLHLLTTFDAADYLFDSEAINSFLIANARTQANCL